MTIWIMTRNVREQVECYSCDEENDVDNCEVVGVIRMPSGTPFDMIKVRKHLVAKHGDSFSDVCFMRAEDITIQPEYLNE